MKEVLITNVLRRILCLSIFVSGQSYRSMHFQANVASEVTQNYARAKFLIEKAMSQVIHKNIFPQAYQQLLLITNSF